MPLEPVDAACVVGDPDLALLPWGWAPAVTGQDLHGTAEASHEGVQAKDLFCGSSLATCWYPGRREVLWVT